MANFGTYEGHRILSDAMDTTLNRQLQRDKMRIADKKIEGEIALNNIEIDEHNRKMARNDEIERQIRDSYGTRTGMLGTLFKDGKLVDNASEILKDYNKSFSMESILAGDTENVLTQEDRQKILNNMTSLAADDVAILKQSPAFFGKSDDEIKKWLNDPDNVEFRNQLKKHQMSTGLNENKELEDIYESDSESYTDDLLTQSLGWGSTDYVEKLGDEKGWGGHTVFKANQQGRTETDKDNLNLIVNAIENSRNAEAKIKNNVADKIFIEKKGDDWWVEERDMLDNDEYKVKFKDGIPYITIDGDDVDLNKMDDWD